MVSPSEQGRRLQGCDFAVGTELWSKVSALPALRAIERPGRRGRRLHEAIGPVRVILTRMC